MSGVGAAPRAPAPAGLAPTKAAAPLAQIAGDSCGPLGLPLRHSGSSSVVVAAAAGLAEAARPGPAAAQTRSSSRQTARLLRPSRHRASGPSARLLPHFAAQLQSLQSLAFAQQAPNLLLPPSGRDVSPAAVPSRHRWHRPPLCRPPQAPSLLQGAAMQASQAPLPRGATTRRAQEQASGSSSVPRRTVAPHTVDTLPVRHSNVYCIQYSISIWQLYWNAPQEA